MYGDLKSDITGNNNWKFIIPGISNCSIPTYNENSNGINANGVTVAKDRLKFIPYLDSAFNVDMFYRVNP